MVGGEAAAPGSLRAGEHTFGQPNAEEVGVYPHFLISTTSGCRKGALPAQGKSQTSERAAKAGSIEAQAANNTSPPQLRSRRAAHSPGLPVGFVRHLSAITTRHRLQRAASVEEKLDPPSSTRLQRVAARRHAPSSAAVARAKTRGERGFHFPLRLSGHRAMWFTTT